MSGSDGPSLLPTCLSKNPRPVADLCAIPVPSMVPRTPIGRLLPSVSQSTSPVHRGAASLDGRQGPPFGSESDRSPLRNLLSSCVRPGPRRQPPACSLHQAGVEEESRAPATPRGFERELSPKTSWARDGLAANRIEGGLLGKAVIPLLWTNLVSTTVPPRGAMGLGPRR